MLENPVKTNWVARMLLAVALSFVLPVPVSADDTVILWHRNFDTAPVDQIVALALKKTEDLYGAATLRRSDPFGPQQALQKLLVGDRLDVVSMATSAERDGQFHTLHFPVFQGLLGHRLCLIRKGTQNQFDAVKTGFDLMQNTIRFCQSEFWPDTEVLRRNGLSVVTSSSYESLFNLLIEGQCDCFLRGAQEIVPEYQQYQQDFEIEKNLVIHYFQPGVIYVNKNNPELAVRLELGLLRAWDDGSYQRLFEQLMGDNLNLLQLSHRHYVPLINPKPSKPAQIIEQLDPLWSIPKWPN